MVLVDFNKKAKQDSPPAPAAVSAHNFGSPAGKWNIETPLSMIIPKPGVSQVSPVVPQPSSQQAAFLLFALNRETFKSSGPSPDQKARILHGGRPRIYDTHAFAASHFTWGGSLAESGPAPWGVSPPVVSHSDKEAEASVQLCKGFNRYIAKAPDSAEPQNAAG